jgi:cell wall-associated NlpC family hydrolase
MPKKILAITLVLMFLFTANAFARSYETEVEKGVNFRSAPNLKSSVFRMIPKGEDIHVLRKVNSYWLEIIVQDGTTGYISAQPQYTDYSGDSGSSIPSTSDWEAKANAVIADAKSLIGKVDYQFGVRDRSRLILDCSSFTEWVYEKQGIDLKWGTRYQKNAGHYVTKANLRKGDLIFFSAGTSSINHVGIYIGNDQFIHNAPTGNVQVSNLDGYWDKNYETARRVI